MSNNISSKTLALCLGVVAVAFSISHFVFSAWTEPISAPPGANVPAPVNVGTSTQIKAGALGVNGIFATYGGTAATSLIVVSGNVGINTSNPAYTLDVNGPLRLRPTAAVPAGANGVMYYNSGTNKFQCYQNGAWADCVGGGGAGVSQIIAGSNITINPASGVGIVTINSTGGGGTNYWTLNGSNLYNNVGTNIGIGTTAPEAFAKLDVHGGATHVFQSGLGGLLLGYSTGVGGTAATIQGRTAADGNGNLILNNWGGNVGIGPIAAPSQKLDVSGQIHATGDICTDAGGGKCLSSIASGFSFSSCSVQNFPTSYAVGNNPAPLVTYTCSSGYAIRGWCEIGNWPAGQNYNYDLADMHCRGSNSCFAVQYAALPCGAGCYNYTCHLYCCP